MYGPASEETKEKMRAAHRARWQANRERYLEANARAGKNRRGKKYLLPRKSKIVNQYGVTFDSIEQACEHLGLNERLVRLVLEGKRGHTGGYTFKLVSRRHEDYLLRRMRAENTPEEPAPRAPLVATP